MRVKPTLLDYGHYKREASNEDIDAVLDAVYALKEKREATKYERESISLHLKPDLG